MSFNCVTAVQYSRTANFFHSWIKPNLSDNIKPKKTKYKKMLDIGCATGEGTSIFADFFKPDSIVGLDKNEVFMEFARCKSNKTTTIYKKCDFNVDKEKDLKEILKEHPDIDLIVSSFSLQYMDNPIGIFQTLKESIGGPVEHVHLETAKLFDAFYQMIGNMSQNPKWKNYLQNEPDVPSFMISPKPKIPSDEFSKVIKDLKYTICKEVTIPISFDFPTREAEVELLKWALPFTKQIPADKQDEFLNECWLELRKGSADPKGKLKWNVENYLLHAISS